VSGGGKESWVAILAKMNLNVHHDWGEILGGLVLHWKHVLHNSVDFEPPERECQADQRSDDAIEKIVDEETDVGS
jgi:hypothetical protein